MTYMHPYRKFVEEYERLYRDGKKIAMGGFAKTPRPEIAADAPTVLIFSPHPDDECIIGALPLRLLRQSKMRVINVAVTQGSKKERQSGRLEELKLACEFMGFELVQTGANGLEKVNGKTRGTIQVAPEIDQAAALTAAMADPAIARFVTTDPSRVIFVKGRLLNIVVKG